MFALQPTLPKHPKAVKPEEFDGRGRVNPAFSRDIGEVMDEDNLSLGTYKLVYQTEDDNRTKETTITVL